MLKGLTFIKTWDRSLEFYTSLFHIILVLPINPHRNHDGQHYHQHTTKLQSLVPELSSTHRPNSTEIFNVLTFTNFHKRVVTF